MEKEGIVAPVFSEYTDAIPDLPTALSQANEARLNALQGSSVVDEYSKALSKHINGEAKKAAKALTQRISNSTVAAMNRVEELIHSEDEQVATKNSHFIIEQVIGKARTTSTNVHVNKSIDTIATELGLD